MLRDLRLIRTLLLLLADGGQPDASDAATAYHLRMMGDGRGDAGWISGRRLTADGRRVAALWRDPAAFDAAISFLEAQGAPVTPALISELMTQMRLSRLAAARIRLGLLQRQVANRAGLDTATICRCERQNRLPQSIVAVRSYAAALGMAEADMRALVARERSRRLVGRAHRRLSCPKRSTAGGRKGGQ